MKRLAVSLVLVSLLSCKSSVPKDILPPKQMQSVLWDMMQADELAEYHSLSDSTAKTLAKHAEYYNMVFASHKITKNDFARSLRYYQDHPSSLKPVLDSLQRFAQALQEKDSFPQKQIKPLIVDSVKRKLRVKSHPL